jgi:hypothetical protein
MHYDLRVLEQTSQHKIIHVTLNGGDSPRKITENSDPHFSGNQNICLVIPDFQTYFKPCP